MVIVAPLSILVVARHQAYSVQTRGKPFYENLTATARYLTVYKPLECITPQRALFAVHGAAGKVENCGAFYLRAIRIGI
jgi:hypothetical protein